MLALRPYQVAAVDAIRQAFKEGKRSVLYQLATGGGKSAIFNHVAAKVSRGGRSACIVVHRDELIQQTDAALSLQDIPHGIIAPGYPQDHGKNVQIASVWTLARRLDQWPSFDLLVFDEAHRLASETFATVHANYPESYMLSVSATPARLDGKGLSDFCQALIQGPPIIELVEAGYLAPCDVYAPPNQLNLDHVKIRGGDYAVNELEKEMDKAVITGSAVEHYRRHVAPKPAIAFCVSIKHCEHVAQQFRDAGYVAESIDGTMDRETRRRLIGELGAGRLNVIASCQILTEGVDTPICQAVIMLRPTQSLTLYLQMAGRAMRPKPDGSAMILLDHVANALKHGSPSMRRRWSLEGRTRTPRDSAPLESLRCCEGCFFVFESRLDACPRCGVTVQKRIRTIYERPGELVRMGADRPDYTSPGIALDGMNQLDAALQSVADTWQMRERRRLEKIAQQRGYRPGWVTHVLERQMAAMRKKAAR